jgi:tetratricopeptide (TPR) repeat protein
MDAGSKGALAIGKAHAEYRDGDFESAIETLSSATVAEEDYLELAYLLGLSHARLEHYDEALLYLEQVVTSGETSERTSQCRLALAYIYSVTNRFKLAEYELMKLLDASIDTPQVFAALGHAVWSQGRIVEGIDWYEKALEKDPENLNALNGYGYLLACAEYDLDKALTCCRKAVDGAPGNPAYADSLGWTYFKLGHYEEASRYLYAAAKLVGDIEESRDHIAAYEKAVFER